MLTIRDAEEKDFARIMEIYRSAQDYMIRSGNPNQWGRFNPPPERVLEDIRQNVCKAVCDGTGIHGVFAVFDTADPTYARIDGGSWLNDAPYLTIHRVAGDGQVHGVFRCAADYCKARTRNIRIDTHADNRTMQRVIGQNGFVKCGTIYLANGAPRVAYQWTAEETHSSRMPLSR